MAIGGSKASAFIELGDKLQKNIGNDIRGFTNMLQQGDLANQSIEDSRFRNQLALREFNLGEQVTKMNMLDQQREKDNRRKFMLAMARG